MDYVHDIIFNLMLFTNLMIFCAFSSDISNVILRDIYDEISSDISQDISSDISQDISSDISNAMTYHLLISCHFQFSQYIVI